MMNSCTFQFSICGCVSLFQEQPMLSYTAADPMHGVLS